MLIPFKYLTNKPAIPNFQYGRVLFASAGQENRMSMLTRVMESSSRYRVIRNRQTIYDSARISNGIELQLFFTLFVKCFPFTDTGIG